jgi:hypothetical protein
MRDLCASKSGYENEEKYKVLRLNMIFERKKAQRGRQDRRWAA